MFVVMSRDKAVLITGATGFVGSHLAQELLNKGYKVRCLTRKTSNLRWLKHLNLDFVQGDIIFPETLPAAIEGVNYIFHIAAVKTAKYEKTYYDINYKGTLNLIDACSKYGKNIKKFVFLSSQAAVGPNCDDKPVNEDSFCNPISYYGKSKLKGEETLKKYMPHIPVVIIRPPSVYGPRDEDMFFFFKAVKRRIKPIICDTTVNVIYIDDLVRGIIIAAESDISTGKIYFMADEKPYKLCEFLDEISKVLNVHAFEIKMPSTITKMAALISELTGKLSNKSPIFNRDKAKEMLQRFWICDVSKAKNELKFHTQYSIKEGIERTVSWYKKYGWL